MHSGSFRMVKPWRLSYGAGGVIRSGPLPKTMTEVLQPQKEQTFLADTQPGMMREVDQRN